MLEIYQFENLLNKRTGMQKIEKETIRILFYLLFSSSVSDWRCLAFADLTIGNNKHPNLNRYMNKKYAASSYKLDSNDY